MEDSESLHRAMQNFTNNVHHFNNVNQMSEMVFSSSGTTNFGARTRTVSEPEEIPRTEADGTENQRANPQPGLVYRSLLRAALAANADIPEISEASGVGDNGQFYWETILEQLLLFEEKANALISEGHFDQAFGILSGVNRFPDSVRDVRFKLNYCASLMLTEQTAQASAVFNSLLIVVRDQLKSNFFEVLGLAERYMAKKNYICALILCLIAAEMTKDTPPTCLNAAYKAKCMSIIREATDKLTKKCDKVRPFIREHVVPTCYNLLDLILATPQGNDRTNSLQELKVTSLHILEVTQLFAEDYHGRVKTLKEALIFTEGVYGSEGVKKRKYYGTHLHNLGATYLHLSKVREATQALTEALECFNIATDFDDENEKKSHIEKTTPMLRLASTGYF